MPLNLSSQVAALNALPYGSAPFANGFTLADYRAQYAAHGERVRLWKAVEMPSGAAGVGRNGRRYFEQILDESVRVLLWDDKRELDDPKFGQIVDGDLRFSSLPDEIELGKDDRILAIDRPRIGSAKLRFNGGLEATIARMHVAQVEAIYDGSGPIDALFYVVEGRVIRWVKDDSPPDEISVRFKFFPMYEFRGEADGQAMLGSDGLRLPQIVPLHLLAVGSENE